MSSAVAPAIVISEPAQSPSTARKRIPSNGRSMPDGRAGAAGGTSFTSWIVVGTVAVRGISAGVRRAGDEGLLLVEPLREHDARDRRRGLRAEAAVLDGDGEHDRPALVGHEAHVPRLVAVARALGGAGLAEDGEVLLVPALEHVGRRAARLRGGGVQALEDRLAGGLVEVHAARGAGVDLLQLATGRRVLDRDAEVRAHDAAVVLDRGVGDRHLQRRGLEVALADGEVDVVADRPGAHVRDAAAGDRVERDVM